ncbi:hypothetical protein SASPL_115566 [Salvia splendens]|uniref:Nucleolar protein 9 n=1 Tax=Salvia splendens TaxID=180675 RepID=A0A8X9A292_SALSN|nr:hypothetical protein SASPL_115566 [Salvia splendens]
MVSVGFRALALRNHNSHNSSQNGLITDQGKTSFTRRKMGRKGSKKDSGFHRNDSNMDESGGGQGVTGRARNFSRDKGGAVSHAESQASFVRKQVDPETAKYFSDITNVIEGTEVDMEERSVICGTALEEARGKEVELATDYIISHTMQTLLKGCTLDRLCSFLRSSADEFSQICMDRSSSHVAETALKSLASTLRMPKTTLSLKRHYPYCARLLCLCKGVPLDSLEFPSTNPSAVLAERLNLRSSHADSHNAPQNQPFPNQLKFLISEMVDPSRADMATLQANQYSSLVLQACTALKLLAGQEEEENAQSHLMEIKLIFEELGQKFRDLPELGRDGVVAALVAASQRLQGNQHECCQALADAVCLSDESSVCIVPRLLFLENYLYSVDKENWSWPSGFKMHVLGSLMLQSIFRYPSEFIKSYINSITSLEDKHVLEASKDPSGARVIEAFLVSSISAKQKYKIVAKFARRPEQWRSRITSKESVFNEVYEAFGQKDAKSSRGSNFLSDSYKNTQAEKFKGIRKERDAGLSSGDKKSKVRGFSQDNNDDFSKSKKHKTSKDGDGAKNEKKRRKKDGLSESSNKKLKAGISD